MPRHPFSPGKLGLLIVVLIAGIGAAAVWFLRGGETRHPDFEVRVSGKGPPVIFIPGIATPGTIWQGTVDALQGKYECHVVTLAGFGGVKPTATDPFLSRVRDELLTYIRDRKMNHPVIVGHSMGGVMAMWMATTAPGVPGRLVVVDALPDMAKIIYPGESAESVRGQIAQTTLRIQGSTAAEFTERQRKVMTGWVTAPADVEALTIATSRSDTDTVGRAFQELLNFDLSPELGKIVCPVLVMVSLADKVSVTPKAEVEKTFAEQYAPLTGVRVRWYEHAKHFIMLDDPAGFREALLGELAKGKESGK